MSANDYPFSFLARCFRDEMPAIESMTTWATVRMKDHLLEKPQTLPVDQSALWKYKAIYLQADQRVGQWSDVVSISVAG